MTDTKTPENAPEAGSEAPAANDPLTKVKGFVEEHPVAMVAGGIVLGALVAGALARTAGDKATRKGTLARMSLPRRAVDLATLGVELAAAYVAGASDDKAAAPDDAPDDAGAPAKLRLPALATKALRTLGPVITRRLPGRRDS